MTIGLWENISKFIVDRNAISGTVPMSVSGWKEIDNFQLFANHLSGGVLPALPFEQMPYCYLSAGSPLTNSFDCPWPDGATAHCMYDDSRGKWNPVPAAMCTGYSCNAATGQCEVDPASTTPPSQCISACHACTGASTQLPADQCNAWIAFYDATGGPHWKHTQPNETNYGKPICSGSRTDPCSCTGFVENRYPVCNRENTAIVDM